MDQTVAGEQFDDLRTVGQVALLEEAFLEDRYRPCDDRLAGLREENRAEGIPIIRRETEAFLAILLGLKKPKRILEIGSAAGYSAAFFALRCPQAEIYTIEVDADLHRQAEETMKKLGLADRVHCLLGDGADQTEGIWEDWIRDFGFVFIDASKSHYREFFDWALKISAPGAVICADDIFQHGITVSKALDPRGKHRTNARKMREFTKEIADDPRLETAILGVGDGLSVSRYLGEE